MDFLVEFLETGGARIIKDPLLIEKKKGLPNVLLSPDISHLKGVSPSFWVREGNTIGTHTPEIMRSIVLDSLTEEHPFSSPQDAPFSSESKFILKIEEIDAKREQDMHNILKSMSLEKKETQRNLIELEENFLQLIENLRAEIKLKESKAKKLFFIYILVMILLKFI